MNRHVYNAATLAGWAMLSIGAGMLSVPVGFMVAGSSLLVLTIVSALLVRGR